MSAVTEQELASLEAFSGEILRPGENGYEEARRGFNGLIDKRPALIARCRGEADIADAIAFARDAGLEISVRGGGHSVAGRCFTEGGLMIDLSLMKGIYVDPSTRIARVQPGVNWSELNRETQLHGLAVTGGLISTTGISGLTLGGGPRVADGEVRPGDRQPAVRPGRDGGRTGPSPRASRRTPTSSGGCAVAAATSASSRRSSTGCTRSGRPSPVGWSRTRSTPLGTCFASSGTSRPTLPTSS